MSRIVFILPGFPRKPGGGHKVVYIYANYLARRHDVTVMHLRPTKPGDHRRPKLKVALINMLYFLGRRARPTWFKLDRRVQLINRARQAIEDVPEADHIVATSVKTASFVADSAANQGVVGSYFIQHFEDYSDPVDVVELTWRLPLNRIVIAPWLQAKAKSLGVTSTLVPNAVDPANFPVGPSIKNRPPQVLSLVSSQPWKRTDLVVEVMASLHTANPNVKLAAFGVGRKPRGFPEFITYHQNPSANQLRRLYQASRIYMCTSDYEGFGLPPAEAMLSGAAIVSTDNHGVRSFADEAAIFVPIGDAASLRDAVQHLLENEVDCENLAARGTRKIRKWSIEDAGLAFEAAVLETRLLDGVD